METNPNPKNYYSRGASLGGVGHMGINTSKRKGSELKGELPRRD